MQEHLVRNDASPPTGAATPLQRRQDVAQRVGDRVDSHADIDGVASVGDEQPGDDHVIGVAPRPDDDHDALVDGVLAHVDSERTDRARERRVRVPNSAASDDRPIEPYAIQLLGDFRLSRSEQNIPLPPQAQRLVAYLALDGAPVRRPTAATRLWPDRPEEKGSEALRSALWQVERRAAGVIRCDRRLLGLDAAVTVDVDDLDDVESSGAKEQLRELVRSRAELLPLWDEDWLLFERERVRQRCAYLLELSCRCATERGEHTLAIEIGLTAVSVEPFRESAHRALLEAHLAQHNVAEAIRQYRQFEELLDDEFGISPSHDLQDLIAAHVGS